MLAFKQLSWSAFSSIGGAVLDIVRIAILARFLAPEDFGSFSIALVVLGFCQLFSEGGVANALVSKKTVNANQAGYILNFSILVSVVVSVVVIMLTPIIANFYQLPVLTQIIPLIVVSIPISSVSRIFQAMLQRNFEIKTIAKAIIFGKIFGLLVAVIAINMSLGIFTLAYSTIAAVVFTALILFKAAIKYVEFQYTIKWVVIKPILSFSIYQLGEFLLNFFAKNFDVLLITKLLGAESSGVYVVSKNLLVRIGDLIVTTFNQYFHPLLAHLQHNKTMLTENYLCFFRSVSLSVMLAYVLIALNHEFIIQIMLGDKYHNASELFIIMAVWLSLRYCTAPVATLWLTRQKPQLGLYWNILVAITIPTAVYLGHNNGLHAVLINLTLAQVLFLLFSLLVTFHLTWQLFSVVAQQIKWLATGVLLVLPFYLLVEFIHLPFYYLMMISIILVAVTSVYVWTNKAIFLGVENQKCI